MWAAWKNPHPEVISLLLEAGALVNARDGNRESALLLAAMNNKNPEVISLLLKAGAEVNAKDEKGCLRFKTRLYKFWREHSEEYAQALEAHIGRHLEKLGCPKV